MTAAKALDKLLSHGEQVRTASPFGDDLAFNHSLLCSLGLPRRPTRAREFLRQAGEGWLYVQAGAIDLGDGRPIFQPIPHGVVPRLALIWISTLAKRSNSPEIFIGRNASEFLRMLGYDTQGHWFSTLRDQLHALAACRLQMGFHGRTVNETAIKRIDAWLPTEHKRRSTWPGTLMLDPGFLMSWYTIPSRLMYEPCIPFADQHWRLMSTSGWHIACTGSTIDHCGCLGIRSKASSATNTKANMGMETSAAASKPHCSRF